jgi:AAA+ ATPase superfamily predicted ATPase
LIDLDILYKEVPVTESNQSKSKKGLYFIKDNFLRFWFRYVFAYKSQLEIGNSKYVLDKIKESFNEYVSKTFEDLAVEYALKRFTLLKCGRWWDKNIEIDVLGIGEDFIIFGECKWQNKKVGIKVYEELVQKSKTIKSDLNKKYILFSKSGFSQELIELADNKKGELFLIKADEF